MNVKTTYYAPNSDTRNSTRPYTHVVMVTAKTGDREGETVAFSFHMNEKNADAALTKAIKLGHEDAYFVQCSTEKPEQVVSETVEFDNAARPMCDRNVGGKKCGRFAVVQTASGIMPRCAAHKTPTQSVKIEVRPESVKVAPDTDTITGIMIENEIPIQSVEHKNTEVPEYKVTESKKIPDNILHMIKHATPQTARDMWRRIANREYGKHNVDRALIK